jgi:hypothetical protein
MTHKLNDFENFFDYIKQEIKNTFDSVDSHIVDENAKNIHKGWCRYVKRLLKKGIKHKDGALEFASQFLDDEEISFLRTRTFTQLIGGWNSYVLIKELVDHYKVISNLDWDDLTEDQKMLNQKIALNRLKEKKAENSNYYEKLMDAM